MNAAARTFGANARWEIVRWRRSRRGWLLIIPMIAGPIGSAISDLYLRVPSVATAEILGLLITGGLGGLVVLDLGALAVGEELASREYLVSLSLPQPRAAAIAGRFGPAIGGPIAAYLVGAALIFVLAPATVTPAPTSVAPLFLPSHLAAALVGLLLFLGAVSAAGAAVTRSSAQGLVAGILAGVLVAGVVGLEVLQRTVSWLAPSAITVAGAAALIFAVATYATLDG